MPARFKDYGVPRGFETTSRVATPAPLHSQVPPFGGFETVRVADPETATPLAQYALVNSNGQPVRYVPAGALAPGEVPIGEDDESTRDALVEALEGSTAVAEAVPESTNIINLVASGSPFILSSDGAPDVVVAITGTVGLSAGNAADGDTVTVGTTTYTFADTPSGPTDIQIGGSAAATATNAAAVIDGNSAVSSVGATDETINLVFVGPEAVLSGSGENISTALAGTITVATNPTDAVDIAVGSDTYALVTAGTAEESVDAAAGVAATPLTIQALAQAVVDETNVSVHVATSGNFLLEGLVLDESISTLSKSEQLRVVRLAMRAAGDNMKVNSNRYTAV